MSLPEKIDNPTTPSYKVGFISEGYEPKIKSPQQLLVQTT